MNPVGGGGLTHEELRDMYEFYALGVLEPGEREAIDEHLARNCEVCTRGVRRALAVNAAVLSFVPEAAATPGRRLRARLVNAVGGNSSANGFAWWPAVLGLVSAGLAITAFMLYTQQQESRVELASARKALGEARVEAGRAQQILDFLNLPETKAVGFRGKEAAPPQGNFFVNKQAGVLLIATRLPKLDVGRTYQMWVIPKGGAPLPAGLFRADERGGAIHLQPGPVDTAQIGAVAVSVEPDGGSAQPTTTPIIVAPVVAGL